MTTLLTLLGGGFGLGLVLVAASVLRVRPSLESELACLDPYSGAPSATGATGRSRRKLGPAAATSGTGLLGRLGEAILGLVAGGSAGSSRLQRDLAVVERGRAEYAATVATASVTGAALPPALAALAAVAGVHVTFAIPLIGCLACAAAGAAVPVLSLRRRAAGARSQCRQALASWLELVALAQAAGMGLESALQAASTICEDSTFRRIRRTVDVARSTGVAPWDGLGRLGVEIGVADLEELGSNLALAGAEGARIRGSLASKAASLRRRALAEAEAEANAMTERLFLPAVVLMLGFVVFIGYPALVTVAHVL